VVEIFVWKCPITKVPVDDLKASGYNPQMVRSTVRKENAEKFYSLCECIKMKNMFKLQCVYVSKESLLEIHPVLVSQ